MILGWTRFSAVQAARAFGVVLLLCVSSTWSSAQVTSASSFRPIDGEEGQGALPNRLEGMVGIVEKLGSTVDQNLSFVDESGVSVRLGSVLGQEKPVVLVFAYHSCPMLCSLVLDGVADAIKDEDLQPGVDYEVLAISIDPRDGPARASEVKKRYVDMVGDPAAAAGMHFWTVTRESEDQVRALATSVGFRYALDPRTSEYAHHAALIFLSPQGLVTRYLYGMDFPARDYRLSLVEAGEGTIGTSIDRFLLTCFEYDEDAQSYSLAVMGLLKIGGGLTMIIAAVGLGIFWRRETRSQNASILANASGDAPATAS